MEGGSPAPGHTRNDRALRGAHLCRWLLISACRVASFTLQVTDVDFAALKAVVRLARPHLCESRVSTFTVESVSELLDLKGHQLPLQELWVVFDESGAFDQTALAVEHVR